MRASNFVSYVEKWLKCIDDAKVVCVARDLYGGVGHSAVIAASEVADAELVFVSAGLGLVDADEKIPSYDLTVTPGGPGPFGVLNIPYQPRQWWHAIHSRYPTATPLAAMVRKHKGPVVLALPANYLQMLDDDLDSLDGKHIDKLRIITTANASLPSRLQGQMIEYDERLNGVEGANSGAMTSLVQRAALHFMGNVLNDRRLKTVASQRHRVERTLSSVETPSRPERVKVDSAKILRVIKQMTSVQKSSVTTALSTLRHGKGIACEQTRFKSLYEKAMHVEK